MKNNSGERAWNAVCIYCDIWLFSWNFIDYITQAGTCFQRERGILQMAAYWYYCPKEKRLFQAYSESNIQLGISLRLFFHAAILIFPACCPPWWMHCSHRDVSEGRRIVLTKTVIGTKWWWGEGKLIRPGEVLADCGLGKAGDPGPACLLCCSYSWEVPALFRSFW